MKLDKKIFQVVDINYTQSDKEYWHSMTPEERIYTLELMRLMAHGKDAFSGRLQRVLTIVDQS